MNLQLNRSTFGNPENKGNVISKMEADFLLSEWVLNPRLQLHMKQVAALMKAWAHEKEGLDDGKGVRQSQRQGPQRLNDRFFSSKKLKKE